MGEFAVVVGGSAVASGSMGRRKKPAPPPGDSIPRKFTVRFCRRVSLPGRRSSTTAEPVKKPVGV